MDIEGNEIRVNCTGKASLVMDALRGHDTNIPIEEKLYTDDEGYIVMPAQNIYGFIYAYDRSCIRSYCSVKEYKSISQKAKAAIRVLDEDGNQPDYFYIHDKNGDRMKWDEKDTERFSIKTGTVKPTPTSPRNLMPPKPLIKAPWKLSFNIFLIKDSGVTVSELKRWIHHGAAMVGLGTFKPVHGVFNVDIEEIDK